MTEPKKRAGQKPRATPSEKSESKPTAKPKPLTSREKQFLRGLGQHIDPVVAIGSAGLSDAVIAQIDGALDHHELIKVRVGRGSNGEELDIRDKLPTLVGAELVQKIGHVIILFRRQPDPERRKVEIPRDLGRASA